MLAALHVSPEAADAGPIAKIREGDTIRIDADAGTMDALVDSLEWAERGPQLASLQPNRTGLGRELFALMRTQVGTAEQGGCSLFVTETP